LKGCLKIWWFGRNNQEEEERKRRRENVVGAKTVVRTPHVLFKDERITETIRTTLCNLLFGYQTSPCVSPD
jgi:hypothetical protein